jgi:hypothetical protein
MLLAANFSDTIPSGLDLTIGIWQMTLKACAGSPKCMFLGEGVMVESIDGESPILPIRLDKDIFNLIA